VLSALLSKCDYFPSLPSAVVNVRPHREAATTDMSMDEPRWTTLSSGDTAVLSCCTYSSRRRAVKFKLSGVKLASNAVAKVCLPAASRWHYAHLALGCGHSPRRNGIWERKVVIGHQPGHTPAGSSTLDPGWVDYRSGGSMHTRLARRERACTANVAPRTSVCDLSQAARGQIEQSRHAFFHMKLVGSIFQESPGTSIHWSARCWQ
jgi:hypothetical protein